MITTILSIALLTIGLGVLAHIIDAALALYYLFTLDSSDYHEITRRTKNGTGTGFIILWHRLRSRGPRTNVDVNAHLQSKANGRKRRSNYAQRRAQLRMRRQLAQTRSVLARLVHIIETKLDDPMPEDHPVKATLATPMFVVPGAPSGKVILQYRLHLGAGDAVIDTPWTAVEFQDQPEVFHTASDALSEIPGFLRTMNETIAKLRDAITEATPNTKMLPGYLTRDDVRIIPYVPATPPPAEQPTEQPRVEEPAAEDVKI